MHNKDIRFSLITATRNRIPLLTTCLELLDTNTKNKESVEILIAYDSDDDATLNMISPFCKRFPDLNIKFFEIERSPEFIRKYINFLAKNASGKYVSVCNDDCEYLTKDWDVIAWETLENFGKNTCGIVYGRAIEDYNKSEEALSARSRWGNFACFPILSKVGIDILGYYYNPLIYAWGGDTFLYKLYEPTDFVCNVPVKIFHNSVHTNRREKDEGYERMKEVTMMAKYRTKDLKIHEDRAKLFRYVKEHRG